MTVFEFVFSLYSLLFGLALAQVFAGFGNTLQERHKLKVGWLTPLLGLFVILDLTSFWEIGWQLKDMFARPYFLILISGVLLAGIYYLAARLVFPRNFVEWPDFDVYYFRHKQWVFGGILFCNVIAAAVVTAAGIPFIRLPLGFANDLTYFVLLIGLLAVRNKRANIILLLLMLSRYAVFPVLGILGVGVHSQLF
ncbi:MAG TPA: hypothetical protein VE820_02345 [Sphingomicrobium sp.]|jgi:hypothetical protein|nr:hypothetical protein [Sphingomicrobium sp.]